MDFISDTGGKCIRGKYFSTISYFFVVFNENMVYIRNVFLIYMEV